MSAMLALVLAATSARVESVGLTTVESQPAVRLLVSGSPGLVAVHREGDLARVVITDAELGLRFAGGHRFSWTPLGVEDDVLARTPARLDRLELAAAASDVSLMVRVPADASVDVRRDARGLVVLFHPASVTPAPAPASPALSAPAPRASASVASVDMPDVTRAEPEPEPAPTVPTAIEPAPAPAPSAPVEPSPADAPAAAEAPAVTPDLARALFPGGQAEAAPAGEGPASVADLYARLFPSGPPATVPEPAAVSPGAGASDDSGLAVGPFRVRAGVDARYVDADTFVDESATTTRDRYLEVAPRVEAEAPLGAGRFTAEYNPWLRAFATYDQVNSSSHVARVELELPVGQNLTLRASDRFVAGTLDTRYADPGGEYFFGLGRFHRNDVDAGASFAIGPRTSVLVSGTAGTVRFTEDSSFFDYDTRLVSAGVGYELTPSLRLVGEYVYDTVPRPDERPEAESTAHEGRLTMRGDILPLLTGELGVGYRSQSSPNAGAGGTSYTGLTLRGSLERRLSSDATLGIFLSRSTPASAFEENAFYVATMLQGTVVLPLPLELQLNAGLGYQWNDYRTVAAAIGVAREDRILGWFVGLRRPILRQLYLSGFYRAEDRRSNLDQFVVDSDGFYVQLEWNPFGATRR